jgi:hypothetical protein
MSQKNNLNRYVFGVMECWSAGVYKIPNSKHQLSGFEVSGVGCQVSGKRNIEAET